jgi:hypothetical protein
MNAPVKTSRFSRRALLKGGALTVGFALPSALHSPACAMMPLHKARRAPRSFD